MSKEDPQFGEVFEWHSDTGYNATVAFVAPAVSFASNREWWGIQIDDSGLAIGEVELRMPLNERNWHEVDDHE